MGMTENISVSAIIVTYNRKKLLLECISSLLSQESTALLDILIIDNASTDGTKDAVQEYIDKGIIQYFNTEANLGGAGGFEFGVRQAAKKNCDYVWLMDDDTIPNSTALKELLIAAEQLKSFGFLSSHALWTDGSTCSMNVQRKNIFRSLKAKEFKQKMIPVEYATFVSLFIPMAVVREVGAPIGDFFVWGDDWEYTRRISKKHKSYVVINSKVIHKMSTNNGGDISKELPERLQRQKYGYRNISYICRMEGFKGRIYHCLKILKDITKIIFKSESDKKERIGIIICGIKEGRKFNPPIKPI